MIVSLDWVFYAIRQEENNSAGASRLGKTLRGLKFLRIMRLLKTAKMMTKLEHIEDTLASDVSHHFSVAKMLSLVLVWCHLVACVWYGLGTGMHDGSGWAQRDAVVSWEFFRRYSTSFHWAITQLGVGGSAHVPTTAGELVFANFVLMFSILVFSSVISSVTNSVAAMHERASEQNRQFRLFRKFCRDNEIPPSLSRRMKKFLQHSLDSTTQKVHQDQIAMFEHLSEPLLAEIKENMYGPCLRANTFVLKLKYTVPGMVRKIAFKAVREVKMSSHDVMFNRGELALGALIMSKGLLEYEHPQIGHIAVEETTWIAEACLWVKSWMHSGNLKAQEVSELLGVEVDPFIETIRTHVQAWDIAHKYAKYFCKSIAADENASDLFELSRRRTKGGEESLLSHDAVDLESERVSCIKWLFSRIRRATP
eukprot:TRINITY_DN91331_c0_g1_i1.p1 TRINITY_DN91331_c0_g1~~TRINITY_DN91331_c0_g1_i1.p1  ORF type:complete len:423 (+),score=84.36 TRINITY_DN91331_c0_g1_i1:1-1269(+)